MLAPLPSRMIVLEIAGSPFGPYQKLFTPVNVYTPLVASAIVLDPPSVLAESIALVSPALSPSATVNKAACAGKPAIRSTTLTTRQRLKTLHIPSPLVVTEKSPTTSLIKWACTRVSQK